MADYPPELEGLRGTLRQASSTLSPKKGQSLPRTSSILAPVHRKPFGGLGPRHDELGQSPDLAPPRRRKRARKGKRKQDPWKDPAFQADVADRLASKALYGGGVPGAGVVPMARLPGQYTEIVQGMRSDTPLQGWDLQALDKDEQRMLLMLMEARKRQDVEHTGRLSDAG